MKNGFYRQPTPLGPIEVTVKDGKVSVKHPKALKQVPVDRTQAFFF